jgi:proteasome lid subunit RPN8/RPN11
LAKWKNGTKAPRRLRKFEEGGRKQRHPVVSTADGFLHNHPSGDPTPSQADIHMTKAIRPDRHPARHFRARSHHRRQERAFEFEGAEADLEHDEISFDSLSF